jgi:predicted ATPase
MAGPIPAADVPVNAAFAQGRGAFVPPPPGRSSLYITPDRDRWNDYGWHFFADLTVLRDPDRVARDGGEAELSLSIRLMFGTGDRTENNLDEIFAQHGPLVEVGKVEPFCMLMRKPEDYGVLVDAIGYDAAVVALRRLGDVVVMQLEGGSPERIALMQMERFQFGMLRAGETFAAMRRGGRFLRPIPLIDVADAATSFTFAAQLPSARNHYVIPFDFAADVMMRNRISVLIGRNGAGKSQVLNRMVRGMTAEGTGDGRHVVMHPWPVATRVLVFSSVASDPYPDTIPPWQGLDYEYFAMTRPLEAGSDALLAAISMCMRTDARPIISEKRYITRLSLLQQVLERLGLWRTTYVPLQPARAKDVLSEAHVHDGQRYFPLASVDRLNESRLLSLGGAIDWTRPVMVFGGPAEIRHLSSGEVAMFRFAAQAVSAIEVGSMLLFDEPETHLHPNFISDFVDLLQDLLDTTKSVAIIATHSAYIVREVPRQRVRILNLVEGEVSVDQPRLQTFGASIDSISDFVFADLGVEHRFETILRDWARVHGPELGVEGIVQAFGHELNPETLSFIAQVLADEARGEPRL